MILLGEFNAKSKSWSVNATVTKEGTIMENLISLYGMKQLISAPTHNLHHPSLVSVKQPILVKDYGIHPSLHQNCHHQVIFCKLNLKIEYALPFGHEVWDYGKPQTDLINCVIVEFHWVNLFSDRNINEQVILFNRTELNTFYNYPVGIYLLKVNKRNTRTRCEICSKLTIKIPERRQWRRFGIFIVNFEHISQIVLVFLLLTLNM